MAGLISNGSYVLIDTVVDVFHDNSLTGNGTENNPLNVNTDVIATKEDVEACVKDSDIVVNSDGFINSINGSYLHSQTSWKDSAGNIIKSTYATKTELANKIQETVLWEGTYVNNTFPNITLSESYKNFEYLEVTLDSSYTTSYPRSEVIQKFSTDKLAIDGACMSFTVTTFNNDNTYSYVHFISYKMSSDTVIQAQFQSMYRQAIPVNTGNVTISNGRRDSASAYEYGITKVVGIHRKEQA